VKKSAIFIAVIAVILCTIAAVSIGVIRVPMEAVFFIIKAKICGTHIPAEWATYEIAVWNLRLPRILLCLITGSILAICGAAFQSVFRNPICDPYILGISSGASLGAAAAIILGLDIFLFGISAFALMAALTTLLLVLGIAYAGNRKKTETILLAGIAINFLTSALITILMVLHQESLQEIVFWTMGSFASATWTEVACMFPIFLVGAFFLFFLAKNLNIMQLGNDTAQTAGVNTKRTTLTVLIIASVLISTAVAFCGVIGFVGLIVPHIARLLFGNNNRTVFAFSIFFGALFCLIADTLARTVASPAELPVGSVTAFAGAPYFIFLLLTNPKKSQHTLST
jgi:iron complex transport system permease protein